MIDKATLDAKDLEFLRSATEIGYSEAQALEAIESARADAAEQARMAEVVVRNEEYPAKELPLTGRCHCGRKTRALVTFPDGVRLEVCKLHVRRFAPRREKMALPK